jgi:CheY-like chemotaxis protein
MDLAPASSTRFHPASQDGDPPAAAPSRHSAEDRPGLDCRVLVVEDDPATLEAVAELLEAEGIATCRPRHGEEALDLLRRGATPALIIVDLMMPVMDGWELCRQIAADEALADTPITIVTAAASIERMPVRRNDAGFFSKPVDYARLLEIVKRYSG